MKFDRSNLGQYDTNPEIEANEGVIYDFAGRSLRLLRAGGSNKQYHRVLQRLLMPHRRKLLKGGELAPEKMQEIFRRVYAETVVVGWDGVLDENGEPVRFTIENVIAFFEAFPEIFDDVQEIASNRASFQEEFIASISEDLGKN